MKIISQTLKIKNFRKSFKVFNFLKFNYYLYLEIFKIKFENQL